MQRTSRRDRSGVLTFEKESAEVFHLVINRGRWGNIFMESVDYEMIGLRVSAFGCAARETSSW